MRRISLSLFFLFSFSLLAAEPAAVEPAKKWTALFDRTSGWLGADGIFSIPLDANDTLGSADKQTKTLFVFSDTMIGTADTKNYEFRDAHLVNHSAAILAGSEPLPNNIEFIYGKNAESNLLGKKYWLQDGIVIDNTLYLTGFVPDKSWKPTHVDMLVIPLSAEKMPKWNEIQRLDNFPLFAKDEQSLVCFGIGILDQSASDGFIYVYGYRDDKQSKKHLLAARVKRESFAEPDAWRFWDGSGWGNDVSAALQPKAALTERISTELSVTPIGKDQFILVFMEDVMSGRLGYKIGSSPIGPFGKTVIFYEAPEPKALGQGIYAYNAKAHPHLSRQNRLLISYNANRFASLPHKTYEYRPRFVELVIP